MDKKLANVESEENKAPNHVDVKEEAAAAAGGAQEIPAAEEPTTQEEEKVTTSTRQPFTSLSQVDQDLALARALQEQERAYMMLRLGSEDSSFDSSASGSHDYDDNYDDQEEVEVAEEGRAGEDGEEEEEEEEEDDDDDDDDEEEEEEEGGRESEVDDEELELALPSRRELDGSLFPDDESYARALQEAEDRDTTAQLMSLAGIRAILDEDEYISDSDDSHEDAWQDVDPDNMSYEELVALGEAVGVENKGLSADVIASLPGSTFVADQDASSSSGEQCVICRLEYEAGDDMVTLPCKHQYHSDCIRQWLGINKVCPICSAEVCTPTEKEAPSNS